MPEQETEALRSFVGRTIELEALERALRTVRAGGSTFLLFAGDGGLGKTRLLEEFARQSGLPRKRILWGRCPEQRGAPALWPWSQALGGFVEGLDEDELRSQLGSSASHVAHVVPAVGERLGLDAPTTVAYEDNRFRIFGGIAGFLGRVSGGEPLILLFDDLHFADGASLALLEFVAQELRDTQVLLVGAYRPREMRPAGATAWMARADEHITLSGLERTEVAEFIEARSGVHPTDAVVSRLHEATEGHPFFLDELVRVLKASGELSTDRPPEVRGRLPEGVRAAIRRRLAPLEAEERRTLELAAVIGRSFDLGVLGLACEASPEQLLERLSAPIASGVVEEVTDEVIRFRFAHSLIREAIYGDLLPASRALAHRRIALALETLSAEDPEPRLAELAHHFYFSAAVGDAAKAVSYASRAALRAMELGAHEESVAHYERALHALALQPPDESRRLELCLSLGLTLWRAGNERQARETFRRAVDSARSLGDAVALARAVMGFNSTWALTGAVDDTAIRLLEEALAALGEGNAPLRSMLLSYLSMRLYFSADRERARTLAREAAELSRRIGDLGSLSVALLADHYVHWQPEELAERREIARRIVATANEAGWPMVALEGRMWCIVDALEEGDLATVDVELDALDRRAKEAGLARWVEQASFLRAMRALLAARFEDAELHRARAVRARPAAEQSIASQFGLMQRFEALRDQGRLAEIERDIEAQIESNPSLPIWRAALALLRADLGRGRDARKILEVLTARALSSLRKDSNWLPTLAMLTEVASLIGDTERAAELGKLLEPYADRMVVISTAITCFGSVERYLGLAAQAAGRLDEADRHLTSALEAHERLGAPALAARSRIELALVLLSRGAADDLPRAAALVGEARELVDAHQLTGLGGTLERVSLMTPDPDPRASRAEGDSRRDERGAAVLRREGDSWTISYGATEFRLKHSKGLGYLAALLREPGREFHVLDLAAGEGESAAMDGPAARGTGEPGEMLDAETRSAYRRRLEDLRDQLEEARSFNDLERAARAEEELDALADELARGMGMTGRSRESSSATERARQNVSRTMSAVLKKISAESPTLGQYLVATVHTGLFCSYDPDPRAPISWIL